MTDESQNAVAEIFAFPLTQRITALMDKVWQDDDVRRRAVRYLRAHDNTLYELAQAVEQLERNADRALEASRQEREALAQPKP